MGIPFLPKYPHIQIVITFTIGNRRHGMVSVFTIQMLISNAVTFPPGHAVIPTLPVPVNFGDSLKPLPITPMGSDWRQTGFDSRCSSFI